LGIATGTHKRREVVGLQQIPKSKQRPPGQQTTQSNLKIFPLNDAVAININLANTLFLIPTFWDYSPFRPFFYLFFFILPKKKCHLSIKLKKNTLNLKIRRKRMWNTA